MDLHRRSRDRTSLDGTFLQKSGHEYTGVRKSHIPQGLPTVTEQNGTDHRGRGCHLELGDFPYRRHSSEGRWGGV